MKDKQNDFDLDPQATEEMMLLANAIVKFTLSLRGDIGVRIAALRTAADALSQAVGAVTARAVLEQFLKENKLN